MRQLVNFCDYFVVCSGNTDRQVKAIADGIDEGLYGLGIKLGSKNAVKQSDWVVFDTGDIVIHVFAKKTREFYNLEYLWQDAKPVKWRKEPRTPSD